jgi:hypothetical protein
MLLLDLIDPFWFMLAFSIGIFVIYTMNQYPDIIIKYPTPQTAPHLIFNDDAENCYKFETKQVECPENPFLIHNIPIEKKLEGFKNKTKEGF